MKAKELLSTITPLLQVKFEKLLTNRVDKLVKTIEKQDTKMAKIADVLKEIYHIKKLSANKFQENNDSPLPSILNDAQLT